MRALNGPLFSQLSMRLLSDEANPIDILLGGQLGLVFPLGI